MFKPYKMVVRQTGGIFDYPVDVTDPAKIRGPKYRQDMAEMVCLYNAEEITHPDVQTLTQEEYEAYGFITVTTDKAEIASDSIDTATVTCFIFVGTEQVLRLIVDELIVAQKQTVNGVTDFAITADSTMAGKVLQIRVECDLWQKSKTLYLGVD